MSAGIAAAFQIKKYQRPKLEMQQALLGQDDLWDHLRKYQWKKQIPHKRLDIFAMALLRKVGRTGPEAQVDWIKTWTQFKSRFARARGDDTKIEELENEVQTTLLQETLANLEGCIADIEAARASLAVGSSAPISFFAMLLLGPPLLLLRESITKRRRQRRLD